MIPLVTFEEAMNQGLRIGILALLAGGITVVVSLIYRWYVNEELPQGVGILFGAAAIAVVLNTTVSLGQAIGGTTELLNERAAAFTILTFFFGAVASEGGRHIGDRFGQRLAPGWALGGLDREVRAYVKGAGRTIRLKLPDEIHDIDGYDPVRSDIKAQLAGETMTLPGRLTHQELHEAFISRLQQDHGIGKADVEFDERGNVVYLAVGRGEAGIGHTLPPGQVATAIRADPAFSASPGDQVRVWRTTPEVERLLTAEIRAMADDIVTLAVEEELVDRLNPESGYRLVTLPREIQDDRAFASVLRRANETAVRITIASDASVTGQLPRDFDLIVLVIDPADGDRLAPPPVDRPFEAGDTVIAMGRPDSLRRFETAAQGTSP